MSVTSPLSFIGSSTSFSFSSFKIRPDKGACGALHRIVACGAGAVAERNAKRRSPYEVLRVKETASTEEIKASYRALAKRFHPDVDPTRNGNGSEFMEIQRAYAALSDPAAKAGLDCERMSSSASSVGVGVGRVGVGPREGFRIRRWETDQCW